MNNKRLGTKYENEVAQILYENGYWVTLLAATITGQPADIIAIKSREFCLIDAKKCSNDVFQLSRVEPNQIRSMNLLEHRSGHAIACFVLGMSSGNYVVSLETILDLMNAGVKSIKEKDCEQYITLEEWCK